MRTKHITGFEGKYVIYEDGRVWSMATNRFLKQRVRKDGYVQVKLYKEGKAYSKVIHRMVAQVFIPEVKGKQEVNHIDGNKRNNHVSNLEWLNRSENMIHAYRDKKFKNKRYMSEDQAHEIMSLKGTTSGVKIAKMFNIGVSTVYDIHNGKTWSHLFKDKGGEFESGNDSEHRAL